MAVAIAELRQRFQTLYDVQGSAVLTSTDGGEVDQLINDGYRALWAEVIAVNKDFRVSTDSFTITSGQTRALPATFLETRFVRRDPGTSQQVRLTHYGAKSAAGMYERSYRLEGANLVIEPLERAPGSYAHDFIPQASLLNDANPNVDAELAQFQDFIVWSAVIEALAREESDIGQFLVLLNGTPDGRTKGARQRVQRWASDQRRADPSQVEDVRRTSPWIWAPP